jgi:hypothetical protein
VAAMMLPWLEMIADEDRVETRLLSKARKLQ